MVSKTCLQKIVCKYNKYFANSLPFIKIINFIMHCLKCQQGTSRTDSMTLLFKKNIGHVKVGKNLEEISVFFI